MTPKHFGLPWGNADVSTCLGLTVSIGCRQATITLPRLPFDFLHPPIANSYMSAKVSSRSFVQTILNPACSNPRSSKPPPAKKDIRLIFDKKLLRMRKLSGPKPDSITSRQAFQQGRNEFLNIWHPFQFNKSSVLKQTSSRTLCHASEASLRNQKWARSCFVSHQRKAFAEIRAFLEGE